MIGWLGRDACKCRSLYKRLKLLKSASSTGVHNHAQYT